MQDVLIVGGGLFVPKALLQEASNARTLIALDGAANHLQTLSIKPDIILGDLDSIKSPEHFGIEATFERLAEDDLPYPGQKGVTIVPALDQNKTDLMKAIEYADAMGASSIDIICASKGRMDHTLMNLRCLKLYANPTRPLRLLNAKETICYVQDGMHTFSGKPGQPCAIMAFPKAVASSTGLKWDLDHFSLTFALCESVCNRLAQSQATIDIQGEALIIAPGHLPSQQNLIPKRDLAILKSVTKELGI